MEEKQKFDELINAVRNKLSPEDFNKLISGLLDMSEEEMKEIFKMAVLIEETTNH